jgi:hypothetical protein
MLESVTILIDECVPRMVKRFLPDHDTKTVQELGYSSFKNGDLLRLVDGQFDLFITADQNIRYQQNLTGRQIAILVLSTNKKSAIKANRERIIDAVNRMTFAEFVEVTL